MRVRWAALNSIPEALLEPISLRDDLGNLFDFLKTKRSNMFIKFDKMSAK